MLTEGEANGKDERIRGVLQPHTPAGGCKSPPNYPATSLTHLLHEASFASNPTLITKLPSSENLSQPQVACAGVHQLNAED